MKRCGKCGLVKPVSEFHRWKRDGHQTWCKACRCDYDRAYHQRNKKKRLAQKKILHADMNEWYRSLKIGRPCTDCGDVFHHSAMTWDHLPGTEKRAEVSTLLQRHSRKQILEEIAKCELVCANCHAVRTYNRRIGT
jgi:hypothetical protein